MEALERASEIYPWMVELRRAIHRHPELAFEERKTAQRLMAGLEMLAIPFEYGGVGGGIIARLGSGRPGVPTVALRVEMDALPGSENTGLPFASQVPGKMHACGHDGHMAMVMVEASCMACGPSSAGMWRGTTVWARLWWRVGVITAFADGFTIAVHGRGGHGARPHEAVDAVVVAALLVMAIQTLVSRETNPAYPPVVTVGKVQAGSAPNVIAEDAILHGTIRTTRPDVRTRILDGLRRMARAIGELRGANVSVEAQEGYTPVVNTPLEADIARRAALKVGGNGGW